MSNEVITVEQPTEHVPIRGLNPLDIAPAEFRAALDRRGENRKALVEWIRSALVDGVDYGSVPLRRGGFSKPSLRKPGAEKICGMLNVTATFPTLPDYEKAALEGRRIEQIIIRCHLISPSGQIVADGVGARSVEQDHGDLNKTLKMALKSAHIDATLRMAGLSEIFTQDIEDMPPGALEETANPSVSHASPPPVASQPKPQQQNGERLATQKQVGLIRMRLDRAKIPESDFLVKFGIGEISALPFRKVNEALSWIDGVAA